MYYTYIQEPHKNMRLKGCKVVEAYTELRKGIGIWGFKSKENSQLSDDEIHGEQCVLPYRLSLSGEASLVKLSFWHRPPF